MANVSQEQLNKWELEYIRCSSNKQLRAYIEKYKSELNNPFVEDALKRVSSEYVSSTRSHSPKIESMIATKSKSNGIDVVDIIKGIGVVCFIGLVIYIGDNWRDWLHEMQQSTTVITPSIPTINPSRPSSPSPTPQLAPEPMPEYVQEQVWVPCYDCNGSGICRYCNGDGWDFVTNGRGEIISSQKCIVCYGNGTCQHCSGSRGHYEMQMRRI